MSSEDRPVEFVSVREEDRVSRRMLAWLNKWADSDPDVPVSIELIDYEHLKPGTTCMALSTIPGTYIVQRFINGKYIAEYQFMVIYRAKPNTPDARLSTDELLNRLGDWATNQVNSGKGPNIGEGLEVKEISQVRSVLHSQMEDGWEDHQISMRMTYMVSPRK